MDIRWQVRSHTDYLHGRPIYSAKGWNKTDVKGYNHIMQRKFAIAVVAALALLTVGRLGAQQPAGPAIEVEKLGPQVGTMVPDFNLPDQHGAPRSLKSLMGPKGAIVVFFRSADW